MNGKLMNLHLKEIVGEGFMKARSIFEKKLMSLSDIKIMRPSTFFQ